jgi:hypothetical protein
MNPSPCRRVRLLVAVPLLALAPLAAGQDKSVRPDSKTRTLRAGGRRSRTAHRCKRR